MIGKELSKHVLSLGPDYKGRGGIASVLTQYKEMLECFHFVATSRQVGKMRNILITLRAFCIFMLRMVDPRITIVHVHSASHLDFFRHAVFVILAKCFHKKVLLHMHGGDFERFYHHHPKLASYVCHKANALIAVSSYFEQLFRSLHLSAHIYLLHNAINPPHTTPVKKDEEERHPKFRLLYIGSINENKGCFDVIKCIGSHKEELGGKIVYHLAGNDETGKFSAVIRQYGLESCVILHGWVDKEKKIDLLQNADCYIQPSYFESFGLSILEAMAHGLPVITSPTGGIPDLVDDGITGLYVAPGDTDGIFSSIKTLMNAPETRRKMGENAIKKASNFYIGKAEKKLISIYHAVLTDKKKK